MSVKLHVQPPAASPPDNARGYVIMPAYSSTVDRQRRRRSGFSVVNAPSRS